MPEVSISDIQAAGVVGAGGAGFPTHVKLAGRADTVIINAAECEPLLHKDKEVLREFAAEVLSGLQAGMRLTGATAGVLGIKEKYHDLIDQLRPMLPGGVKIHPLQDAYPAGDEFILVYDVLGRVIPPGGIPLNVSAVVMNVETARNVARAAAGPVTEKFVSVAGAVAEPQTLRVPLGVSLAECVAAAGGATCEAPAYIVGGVMMGRLEEDAASVLVEKTTGAVIVLPAEHIVVRRFRRDARQVVRIGRSGCDQCCFCTEMCPRYLLGHPIEPHKTMRSLGFNLVGQANILGAAYCCECNLCSMYSCPEDLDPRQVCGTAKRKLAAEGVKWDAAPFNPKRPGLLMANRKAPTARLIAKLGLRSFRNVGPLRPELLETRRVGIKLKQHVGAACEAVVSVGQAVRKGDILGRPPIKDGKPALGAPIHASIDGTVKAVAQGVIWVEKT